MMTDQADCVEWQHRGGQRIAEVLKEMTQEQRLAYWQARMQVLQDRQRALRQAAFTERVEVVSVPPQ